MAAGDEEAVLEAAQAGAAASVDLAAVTLAVAAQAAIGKPASE
jgi:hypothetical protein